jgi:hypothetical protein
LEILHKGEKDSKENDKTLNYYDKDKYREMILGYFGFDKTVYENPGNNRKKEKKWYEELQQERTKDIQSEMMMEKQ